jgi:hypothetical protein
MMPDTYWNGEPTRCERVVVKVGKAPDGWWCVSLEGTERDAVAVYSSETPFYLDDEGGRGWMKVTTGGGSPHFGHHSLPASSKIVRPRSPMQKSTSERGY